MHESEPCVACMCFGRFGAATREVGGVAQHQQTDNDKYIYLTVSKGISEWEIALRIKNTVGNK